VNKSKKVPVLIQSFFTAQKHKMGIDKLGLSKKHHFSPKRLSDFSTGRYCALKALEQIGVSNVTIPIGKDREPVWPDGIVGSISHCDSLVGAIVAKDSDHISLGLDIEEIGRVTHDLWDWVFTENEKKYLFSLSEKELDIQSTAIFSIKEAFYKFQFPLSKLFLDFLDVELVLPDLSQIIVLSETYSLTSDIQNNRVNYYEENNCIVAIIT